MRVHTQAYVILEKPIEGASRSTVHKRVDTQHFFFFFLKAQGALMKSLFLKTHFNTLIWSHPNILAPD